MLIPKNNLSLEEEKVLNLIADVKAKRREIILFNFKEIKKLKQLAYRFLKGRKKTPIWTTEFYLRSVLDALKNQTYI